MSSPFKFTQLVEPSTNADPSHLPNDFQPTIAYLAGQCCSLSYQQYAKYPDKLPTSGPLDKGWTYELIGDPIFTYEAISASPTIGKTGDYRKVPAGFAAVCKSHDHPEGINIIALRGTSTNAEWIKDIEAYPTQFLVGDNNGQGYEEGHLFGCYTEAGTVYGGFLDFYTQGINGKAPVRSENGRGVVNTYYNYSRPDGSIAKAIQNILEDSSFNANLPLCITGHSLGAGLAIICATDIQINFPSKFSELGMYNLAGPRVAAGIEVEGHTIFGPASKFVNYYDSHIPHSFRIVNAADIIPIVTPTKLTVGPGVIDFAHVVAQNQVSFCAQTGSIIDNHSCDKTYVPYLKLLAENMNPSY